MKNLSDLCKKCGKCCQAIVLPVSIPIQKSMMVDWLETRGCSIVNETPDTLYIQIDSPCPNLVKSEKGFSCSIYADRPEGCRLFDGRNYDFLKCAWKDNYVILEKSIKGFIGARKFIGRSERKRTARRASRERKEEKAEDVKLYGSSLEQED